MKIESLAPTQSFPPPLLWEVSTQAMAQKSRSVPSALALCTGATIAPTGGPQVLEERLSRLTVGRTMAAPPTLSEDDIYRTSTQYRLWSYSRESLAAIRASTNERAAARVRLAFTKVAEKNGDPEVEVDCLTPEEELKLVSFYCSNAMKFSDFLEYPTNIKVCHRSCQCHVPAV